MTLSFCIATIAQFLKKSTLSSHDFETFQPKIGHCAIWSFHNFYWNSTGTTQKCRCLIGFRYHIWEFYYLVTNFKKKTEFPLVDISGPKFRFILLRRVYLISRIRDLCGLALVSDYWLSTKSDFLDTFLLLGVWDHCNFKSLTIKPSCTSFFSVWCTDFKIVIFEKKSLSPFRGRWGQEFIFKVTKAKFWISSSF